MKELIIINESKINVSHNLDEIKAGFMQISDKYKNLIVTEDILDDIRKEVADINKIIKNVNDNRISISKELEAPSKKLKAECDDILQIGKDVVEALNSQVNIFREKERSEKREYIQELIKNVIIGYKITDEFVPRLEIQEKWLNKTTSKNSIEEEINNIAKQIQQEVKEKQERERMLIERTEAINKINSGNSKLYGFDLGISKYLYSENSIVELMDIIKNDYQKANEIKIAEQDKEKEQLKNEPAKMSLKGGVEPEIVYELKFKFTESNKKEIDELLIRVKQLCKGWVKQ
jgi:hypothetical protein